MNNKPCTLQRVTKRNNFASTKYQCKCRIVDVLMLKFFARGVTEIVRAHWEGYSVRMEGKSGRLLHRVHVR